MYTGSANWTQDAYTIGDEMVIRLSTATRVEAVQPPLPVREDAVDAAAEHGHRRWRKIRPYNLNPIAE